MNEGATDEKVLVATDAVDDVYNSGATGSGVTGSSET